jgi:protein-tyrosine phosphatase
MKNLKLNIKIAQNITFPNTREEQSSKLECTKISEHIYLSSYHSANDITLLSNYGITHIINCASNSKNCKITYFPDIQYLLLDIRDEPGFDLIYSIFQTIDCIENCIKQNSKILLHCFEGVSRGPAILASYLMWKLGFDKNTAIEKLREKRKCVDINLGFLYQLNKWSDLLKFNKEFKYYRIGSEGISLLDRDEAISCGFSVLLMIRGNDFYKIINKNEVFDNLLVERFITLLQAYENYPADCYSLYIENTEIEKILNGY